MEEMLKDRSGGIVDMDLIALIRQNEEMLAKYFEKDISEYHIKTVFNYPDTTVHINGNAEQLSKTFMSLLGNAVYATVKKAQRTQYAPEIDFTITPKDDTVEILIKDNGIGIEDTIINKVFDPFFTTKTTGEASGVGLYLSREIIQNYGGDISVTSQKNEYTEFSIILPINNGGYGETN
jgi:signal transduction histidine kinase